MEAAFNLTTGIIKGFEAVADSKEIADEIKILKASDDSTLKDYTEHGAITGATMGVGFAQGIGLVAALMAAPVRQYLSSAA